MALCPPRQQFIAGFDWDYGTTVSVGSIGLRLKVPSDDRRLPREAPRASCASTASWAIGPASAPSPDTLLVATALAMPFAYAQRRFEGMNRCLGFVWGLVSLALGLFVVYQIGFVHRLPTPLKGKP
jgi:hypothetical protein